MRYNCANCDHSFETDDKKPRCPQCLRQHGLLADDGTGTGKGTGKAKAKTKDAGSTSDRGRDAGRNAPEDGGRRRLIIAAAVVAFLVGGGYGVYRATRSKPVDNGPKTVSLGPVSAKTLRAVARRRGTPVTTVYFEANKAIRDAGRRHARNPDGAKVAQALLKEVRQSLGKKGMTIRRPGRTKHGAIKAAGPLYAAIRAKDIITVYSYELASLYLALARAAGLHAVMAEIYRHTDLKGPADPLGHVGHFGVAIYAKSSFAGRPVMVVDPARGTLNAAKEYEVFTDLRALAHGLALEALQLAENQSEAAAAIERMDAALRLAPRSATLLAAKGMFLLKSGGVDPALNAFLAARSIREDAPRYLLVAMSYTQKDAAKGVMNRALSNMDQAINRDPGYALAYVMKADLLLRQGKVDLAATELDKAQEIDPNLVEALQARALILLAAGKPGPGVALLQKAVQMDPLDDQARFQLWRVYLQLEKDDEAKAAAKEWLAMLPSHARPQAVQLMERFQTMFKKYKAQAAPVPGAGGVGPGTGPGTGDDPYKLKMPGQSGPGPGAPGAPGAPGGTDPGTPGGTSPFPDQDKKLQL